MLLCNSRSTFMQLKGSLRFRVAAFVLVLTASPQGRPNGFDQRLFSDRLAQEIYGPCLHRAPLLILARSRCEKNDGDLAVDFGELTLQFQAVHFRHTHIEDEARGVFNTAGAEKFKSR